MATTLADFQRGNDGTLSSNGDFTLSGNWQRRLTVLADNRRHHATLKLFVPAERTGSAQAVAKFRRL